MDKNGFGLETNNGKEKSKKKKKKLREQYLIFSPACCNTDNKIINNTWIIRDSVSTIPKYHYVNNEVSKQNQYLTSN